MSLSFSVLILLQYYDGMSAERAAGGCIEKATVALFLGGVMRCERAVIVGYSRGSILVVVGVVARSRYKAVSAGMR